MKLRKEKSEREKWKEKEREEESRDAKFFLKISRKRSVKWFTWRYKVISKLEEFFFEGDLDCRDKTQKY